jgi:succinylglutamate desuccinylase/aspartoacylase family protein
MGKMLEMSFLKPTITFYSDSERSSLPDSLLGFLRSLDGLTVFDIKGKDTNRCRVVTTLIHGNEPSGLVACHLWLRSNEIPATNLRIILCNPEAALTKPFFTNRFVQHSDDLNRFFDKFENSTTGVAFRAKQIYELVKEVSPEAIVDLHNTSGVSPAFSVSVSDSWKHLKLAELFTSSLIHTEIHVGAIMELDFNAPIVTIECGGANDNSSHRVAADGLQAYFSLEQLFTTKDSNVVISRNPIRVKLSGDASVGFSHHRLTTTDITLRADIEELNHQLTPRDEFIGWCCPETPIAFQGLDKQQQDQIGELFENRKGCLFTKKEMQLFMVTTVPEIATKDCLFYATVSN